MILLGLNFQKLCLRKIILSILGLYFFFYNHFLVFISAICIPYRAELFKHENDHQNCIDEEFRALEDTVPEMQIQFMHRKKM